MARLSELVKASCPNLIVSRHVRALYCAYGASVMVHSKQMPDHARRHPRCPNCRYDLAGTVADNQRRCPECGQQFKLSELIRERREGDWTFALGLKNVCIALLLRGLVTLVVWAVVVFGLSYVFNLVPVSIWTFGVIALVLAIPGVSIGHAMSQRLTEIAGCESVVLTTLAVVMTIAVVWCGVAIAGVFNPMPNWSGFTIMATTFFAGLWITRNMHLAD